MLSVSFFLTAVWGLLDVCFRCRFFSKILGTKYRCTYVWFYLGNLLYGQMNVRFSLAVTGRGNLIYSCVCALLLSNLLFCGSVVKKSFFTVWTYCIPGVAFGVFYPLFYASAVVNGAHEPQVFLTGAVGIAALLIQYLMMEILQRRLQALRLDFTDREAVYLIYIIIFIYAAADIILKMFVGINDWKSGDVFRIAIPCSMLSLSGLVLYMYCVVSLEKQILKRLTEQQYQMMERHIEAYKEQYEQLVKIKHDIKNHGLCVKELLKNGKSEEALYYLEQFITGTEQTEYLVQTGSVFADALLNLKYRQAKRLGISITIQMTAPGEDKIAPVDLCCLLANALDNAIEACGRQREKEGLYGWIRAESKVRGEYWVLEISNSSMEQSFVYNGKFLSSKRGHSYGVGLQNIKAVVERYEGVLEIQNEEDFTLNVMLPIPPASKEEPSASLR